MNILSSLVKRMKREKNACYVPALSFEERKVTRGMSFAKCSVNDDFAQAYLSRVRTLLRAERKEKTVEQIARRAMGSDAPARPADELDEMIESLSLLAGLNVSERAYYARPRRK